MIVASSVLQNAEAVASYRLDLSCEHCVCTLFLRISYFNAIDSLRNILGCAVGKSPRIYLASASANRNFLGRNMLELYARLFKAYPQKTMIFITHRQAVTSLCDETLTL